MHQLKQFNLIHFRSIKSLQELLYLNPHFTCANEAHLRLGLMLKANGEFRTALKHLQLALIDKSPSTFTELQGIHLKFVIIKLKYYYQIV